MAEHVVLSQIRADMWKKNGVAMRGQYHHYREMGVREATLDQEFFLLQFGLCIIDPFKFMVALIDRFGLSEFYGGDVLSSAMWENKDADPKQRIAMLEDFVLLIIHLVSDSATVNGWDQDRITRKHIVHQLVLHNLTYSELVKKLPERSTDRGSILPFLEDIADFKEPTETANGSYTLKVECYDEVDPYWRHYSRNDQRVALEKLTNRAKKLDSDTAEPLVLPRPLEIPEQGRPFSNLADFLHTHVVAEMVHWTIAHCMVIADPMQWPGLTANKNEAPQLETLLDLGLHLIILALSVAPKEFAETSVDIIEASGSMSTFQNLWYMQTTEAFKPFRPKIDHILSIIVTSLPESYTTDYRAQREQEKNAMKSPDKPDPRLAAGARQKVIMAEFARKQADFAALMDEAVEEEDIAEDVTTVTYGQCIVCQDDVTMKSTGGMLALLQPSRVLRDVVHERDWFEESLLAPTSLDEATRCPRYGQGTSGEPTSTDGYPSANLRFGVYMSACSHLMHESCMATYFDATRYRHTQQVQRHHPENAVRMEYLCPLCKSLGNVLIPLDPSQSRMKAFNTPSSTKGGRPPTLSERIRSVSEEGLIKISESARIWDHHVETGELVPWFSDCNFSVHTLDPINRRQQMRGTSRMIERMRNLLRPLSEQSQRVRSKKTHMYLPDDVVGYTVAVCEVAQRGLQLTQGLTVAEQVPEMSTRLIERLIGMLQLELDLFFGPKYDRTALRVGIFARFLPDWYRASTLPSPLLLRQPLGIVIEAAAIAPDLLQAVIVMAYYAELTRCMLGLSIFAKRCLAARTAAQPRSRPIKEILASDAHSVFSGFRSIMQSVLRNGGPFTDTDGVLALLSDEMLSKLLYAHTLPFLRRCAIVYHAVAGGYPVTNTDLIVSDGCEYNRLLSLMGIPRPKETLQNPHSIETPIVARWLTQWAMQGRIVPPLEYPGTYELCRLPKLWEDVVLRYSEQRCDNCGTKPTFPALCLYCGKFLCLGGDCCADGEQGECNLHMRE